MKYKDGIFAITSANHGSSKRMFSKMETEDRYKATERDLVRDSFASERGFKDLLKDQVFVDYFNTFLSLPVFAKRLSYRSDSRVFEIDIPSGHECHHCSQQDVLSFAWKERGPLFMKTDICNEYRLCKLLLKELCSAKADEKYSLDLQRELGSVLSMQRLKAFLHESTGESVLSFWLAAERYRRQTPQECLRFLIREIQDKYVRQGAWLALQERIKVGFNSCLEQLLDGSSEGRAIAVKNELLVPCQEMALSSLISYWVPKYLAHRSHKRQQLKSKWRAAFKPTEHLNVKAQLTEALRNIRSKMELSPEMHEENLSSSSNSREPELQFLSEKSSIKDDANIKNSFHENDVLEIVGCDSVDRSEIYSPDTVLTFEDDDSDEEGSFKSQSHGSHSPLKLPQLDTTHNVVLGKKQGSNLSGDFENNGKRQSINALRGNGNQLAAVCSKFRDVSLSRTIALTSHIRGSSIVDVETNFAFPNGFDDNIMPSPKEVDEQLEHLWTALAADQFAGQPFCDYLRLLNHDQAFANIRFWAAAQGFLSSLLYMDTLTRRRQAQALIHIYLLKDSPRKTCLMPDVEAKLCNLLQNDLGYTALSSACWQCAKALLPFWMEFLDLDEERFAETVNHRISSSRKHSGSSQKRSSIRLDDYEVTRRKKVREKIPAKNMWNALQLAISISVPRTAKPILEGYEDADDEVQEDQNQGSLYGRRLRVLNQQAAQALEDYRKCNPYQSVMAYYFYQQNLLLGNMGSTEKKSDHMTTVTRELTNKNAGDRRPMVPRPRCFQEVLHDPLQLDAFKKYLNKQESEIPILFWQAVESMRVNTKEAKQRQHRANGILRRFFGPSTGYGKALDCTADIVKDLPQMNKVTPAMLVSAQTCVARSMEEKWFSQYLAIFPGAEELAGITALPSFSSMQTQGHGRSIKERNRGLWKMLSRNVVSFRRGIANHRVLKHFQNFLRREHKLNVKRSKERGEEGPEKLLIKSKLVSTEKLVNDLTFWIEVDRYKEFADAVVLFAKLGNYQQDDELIVTRKAKAIVNCFIDSMVPPRIQINIPADVADNIMSYIKSEVFERALFHDAAFSIFPGLLYFWKKFCHFRILPKEKLPECPSSARTTRSTQIERTKLALQKNQFRRVSVQPGDEYTKIMFSLQNGIRIAIVPLEDEKICDESHKLPKINPFNKLINKLSRT